jgi:hypothetical protein
MGEAIVDTVDEAPRRLDGGGRRKATLVGPDFWARRRNKRATVQ